jgi:large conductance mechanosensitive channel
LAAGVPISFVGRERTMAIFSEFKKFAMRGNVVDLAVGVVIGAAFTSIVNSLVKDIITPPIGWLTGGLDFSNLFFVLQGDHPHTLAEAQKAGAITINYGVFLNAVVSFLIVAMVLFLMLRQINKLKSPEPETPDAPPENILLLREIRDLLKARP